MKIFQFNLIPQKNAAKIFPCQPSNCLAIINIQKLSLSNHFLSGNEQFRRILESVNKYHSVRLFVLKSVYDMTAKMLRAQSYPQEKKGIWENDRKKATVRFDFPNGASQPEALFNSILKPFFG